MASIVKKCTVTGTGSTKYVIKDFINCSGAIFHWSSWFTTDSNLPFKFGVHRNIKYHRATSFWRNLLRVGILFRPRKDDIHFRYRVSIIDSNGTKQHTKEFLWHFVKTSRRDCEFDCNLFIADDDNYYPVTKYLVKGNLTLLCEVDVVEMVETTGKTIESELKNPTLKDYKSLLESGKLSDVTFVIHGKEFQLHKTVLAAQSKVFAAIFEHEARAKLENRVVLTDIAVDAFEELLRYIYLGQIPDLEKHALELFKTANKYQLDHLKLICGQSLSSKLDIESAANTLLLADMYNAAELESQCIAFITKNFDKVRATESWKNLLKTRFGLVVGLYIHDDLFI